MKRKSIATLLITLVMGLGMFVLTGCDGADPVRSSSDGWDVAPSARQAPPSIDMPMTTPTPEIPFERVAAVTLPDGAIVSTIAAAGVTEVPVSTLIGRPDQQLDIARVVSYHPRLGGRESTLIEAGYTDPVPTILRYLRPGVYAEWALQVEAAGYYYISFRHVAGYVSHPNVTINGGGHYTLMFTNLVAPGESFNGDSRPWYAWRWSAPVRIWMPAGGVIMRFTAAPRYTRQYYWYGHACYLWAFRLEPAN